MLLLGDEVEMVCGNDCDELCKIGVKVCCCWERKWRGCVVMIEMSCVKRMSMCVAVSRGSGEGV